MARNRPVVSVVDSSKQTLTVWVAVSRSTATALAVIALLWQLRAMKSKKGAGAKLGRPLEKDMFIQLLPSNTRGGVALLVDDDCLLEESGADEQRGLDMDDVVAGGQAHKDEAVRPEPKRPRYKAAVHDDENDNDDLLADDDNDDDYDDDLEDDSVFGSKFAKHVNADGVVVWKRADNAPPAMLSSCSVDASDASRPAMASPLSPSNADRPQPPPPLQQKTAKSVQVPLRVYSGGRKQPPKQKQHASRALARELDAQAASRERRSTAGKATSGREGDVYRAARSGGLPSAYYIAEDESVKSKPKPKPKQMKLKQANQPKRRAHEEVGGDDGDNDASPVQQQRKKPSLSRLYGDLGLKSTRVVHEQCESKAAVAAAAAAAALAAGPPQRMEELYNYARTMLRRQMLVGRAREQRELEEFVSTLLRGMRSGAIYVYGPSGVGKSLTVAQVTVRLSADRKLAAKCVTVNLAAEEVRDLHKHVLERVATLAPELVASLSGDQTKAALRQVLEERAVVLVLEEADQRGPHQAAVRELWAMASERALRLVVVALGNDRNFISSGRIGVARDEAAVSASASAAVSELHFMPYARDELLAIVTGRLTPAVVERLFEGIALKLLGDRVAAENGDLRSMVAMVLQALDVAEERYLSRLVDGPEVGRVNATVMRNVFDRHSASVKNRVDSVVAGLTPAARQLLVAMVKDRHLNKGGASEFSEQDIRKLYCDTFRADRPEPHVLKTLLGALMDAAFLVQSDVQRYVLRVELHIAQQAMLSDKGLQAIADD